MAEVTAASMLKWDSWMMRPRVAVALDIEPSKASRNCPNRASRVSRFMLRTVVKSLTMNSFLLSSGSRSWASRSPVLCAVGVRLDRKMACLESRELNGRTASVLIVDGGPTMYAHRGSPATADVTAAASVTSGTSDESSWKYPRKASMYAL